MTELDTSLTISQPKRQILEPDTHCNALNKDKEICKHIAGWGTPHEGNGRCKWHGGLSPTKTGLPRSNFAPVAIKDIVDDIRADSDVADLRNEIAIARAQISVLDVTDNDHIIFLNSLLNTVGKLVERLNTIEVARRYLVPAEEVEKQLRVIFNIIIDEISDPDQRARVADRLEAAMTLNLPVRRK